MKVTYVIGHRPVDRETGNDNLIFYGLEETTLYRNMKHGFPLEQGGIVTVKGIKYRVMNMSLESADSLKLWLYPVDTYLSDIVAGKPVDNKIERVSAPVTPRVVVTIMGGLVVDVMANVKDIMVMVLDNDTDFYGEEPIEYQGDKYHVSVISSCQALEETDVLFTLARTDGEYQIDDWPGDDDFLEPEDHTDDICSCGDPDCNRPMGHSRED